MKKGITLSAVLFSVTLLLSSCGKKASDYDNLVKEYKDVMCVSARGGASMEDMAKALEKQAKLNEELKAATENLSDEEKVKLASSLAKVFQEISEGKCN